MPHGYECEKFEKVYNTFFKIRSQYFFKLLKFLFIFLDRGEGGEKERKRHINVWLPLMRPLLGTWPTTQACVLTENQTDDPLVRRLALNPLNHTSQGCIQYFQLMISKQYYEKKKDLFSFLFLMNSY